MALSNAVQGATHTAQQITWVDGDGDPLNLTGATLSGRRLNLDTQIAAAIDGVLTVIDGEAGVFNWAYGVGDVATAGAFRVQFVATYDERDDKTLAELWMVEEAI
jgi:hypothetical protein